MNIKFIMLIFILSISIGCGEFQKRDNEGDIRDEIIEFILEVV